jgi:hypothetical protein
MPYQWGIPVSARLVMCKPGAYIEVFLTADLLSLMSHVADSSRICNLCEKLRRIQRRGCL